MHKLAQAILWREYIEVGEMIQSPGYNKTYMSFKESVSQMELDAICIAINTYYKAMGSNLRIVNSMGELRPAKVKL